jgi:hypothetical protein
LLVVISRIGKQMSPRVYALARQFVQSHPMRTAAAEHSAPALLAEAVRIALHELDRYFQHQQARIGCRRPRGVTTVTLHEIKDVMGESIAFSESPPIQPQDQCLGHMTDILTEQLKKHGKPKSPPQKDHFKALSWLLQAFSKDFQSNQVLTSIDDLQDIYHRHGSYVLRAPLAGTPDFVHAMLVFCVLRDRFPDLQGEREKTMVCLLDSDDTPNHPVTRACYKTAYKLGLDHPSKLSHQIANRLGVEKTRLRIIELEELSRLMLTKTIELQGQGHSPSGVHTTVHKRLCLRPSPQAEDKLKEIIRRVYPEVEKLPEEQKFLGWLCEFLHGRAT